MSSQNVTKVGDSTYIRYTQLVIGNGAWPTEAPEDWPNPGECWLIQWQEAGIMVRWPPGTTAKEALLLWARCELERREK